MGDVYMVNGKILSGLPNHAKDIEFDNTGTDFISTNAEDAIKEVNSNSTQIIDGIEFKRIGKVVTINIYGITGNVINSTTIPQDFRPDSVIINSVLVVSSNNRYMGNIEFKTDGTISANYPQSYGSASRTCTTELIYGYVTYLIS